jgi:hypothetical protein
VLSVGEQCASDFQLGLGHEDLARAVGCDSLERRIRRLGNAVTALDAGGAKQPAHHLGLHLAGHCGNYNAFVHARRLLDERPGSGRLFADVAGVVFVNKANSGGPGRYAKLRVGVLEVLADRPGGDPERGGDLGVSVTLGDEREDLSFACRQAERAPATIYSTVVAPSADPPPCA